MKTGMKQNGMGIPAIGRDSRVCAKNCWIAES